MLVSPFSLLIVLRLFVLIITGNNNSLFSLLYLSLPPQTTAITTLVGMCSFIARILMQQNDSEVHLSTDILMGFAWSFYVGWGSLSLQLFSGAIFVGGVRGCVLARNKDDNFIWLAGNHEVVGLIKLLWFVLESRTLRLSEDFTRFLKPPETTSQCSDLLACDLSAQILIDCFCLGVYDFWNIITRSWLDKRLASLKYFVLPHMFAVCN